MLDSTSSVKLDKKQKRLYLILRLFAISSFILITFVLTKNFLFPKKTFYFDSATQSLANTISRPYETSNGTSFHALTDGEFDHISISMTLPKNAPKPSTQMRSLVKKSYLAFLSPISTDKYTDHIVKTFSDNDAYYLEQDSFVHPLISKNAFDSYLFKSNTDGVSVKTITDKTLTKDEVGFAPATLISSKEGVFVIDGESMHPVQDERTFKVLGYNFDNVIETSSEERSHHEKRKILTVSSSHPFGTIFYTDDTDRAFIFDHDTLNKISVTKNAKDHAIITQEASREVTSPCTFKKSLFSQKYVCTAPLDAVADFNGNTYHVTLDNMPNTEIDKIQMELVTTISEKSFEDRINALKRRLTTIYN